MKTFLMYTCILILILSCTGCTMQFKAKEIELEGHSNATYEFEKFAWTEPIALPTKPAD